MIAVKKSELEKYVGQRKHSSQMTEAEIHGLWERLKEIEDKGLNWKISGHALERMEQKGIVTTYKDIVSTIHNASMVEYKIDYNRIDKKCHERVVIRSKDFVNINYNLHVVFSLTNRKIISVWMNHKSDFHNTLKWEIYNKDMKIFGV
jgi:hypothetical protein